MISTEDPKMIKKTLKLILNEFTCIKLSNEFAFNVLPRIIDKGYLFKSPFRLHNKPYS